MLEFFKLFRVDKGDGDEEGPAAVEVGAGMGC